MRHTWSLFLLFLFIQCSASNTREGSVSRSIFFRGLELDAPREHIRTPKSFFSSMTYLDRDRLGRDLLHYPCFTLVEWEGDMMKRMDFCHMWQLQGVGIKTPSYYAGGYFLDEVVWYTMKPSTGNYFWQNEYGHCKEYFVTDNVVISSIEIDGGRKECRPLPELIEWRDQILSFIEGYSIDWRNGDSHIYPDPRFLELMRDFEMDGQRTLVPSQ